MSNSLAVRQFFDLANGRISVRKPRNLFQVEAVRTESRYCLTCCKIRRHDVAVEQGTGLVVFTHCRACEREKVLLW